MFDGVRVVGVDSETLGLDAYTSQIRLIQLSDGEETRVFDMWDIEDGEFYKIQKLMECPDTWKVFHNANFDTKFMLHWYGWKVYPIFDTMLGAQVLEGPMPGGHFKLDAVARRYTGIEMSKDQQKSDWAHTLSKQQLEYAAKDAEVLVPLAKEIKSLLIDNELMPTARLEFDAVPAFVEMELAGMKIDVPAMEKMTPEVREAMWRSELEFSDIVYDEKAPQLGLDFGIQRKPVINVGSPQQVKEALESLGLDLPDTKEATLRRYKGTHKAVECLLDRRHSGKVLGYLEAYPGHINLISGRMHPSFNQCSTITGRVACNKPNIQQIPGTTEFRSLFIAEEGYSIMSADFDAQEMRILAEVSQEPVLLNAFASGNDLHKTAASLIYGKPINEISKKVRTVAKSLQFGILYGRGPKALGNDVGIPEDEAKDLIDTYFEAYPQVNRWINGQHRQGGRDGFVRSLGGRKCTLTMASETGSWRREAVNYVIQSTAADMMKAALVLTQDEIRKRGYDATLIATIHDECLLEVKDEEVEDVEKLVLSCMAEAGSRYVTVVPVLADVVSGPCWIK